MLTLGIDTIVDEEGLADEIGDNRGCMLMLKESKTDTALKMGETLGKVHTGIYDIDAAVKTGVLNAPELKIVEVKIVGVLTDSVMADSVMAGSVMEDSVEELVINSVNEVTGSSTVETRS